MNFNQLRSHSIFHKCQPRLLCKFSSRQYKNYNKAKCVTDFILRAFRAVFLMKKIKQKQYSSHSLKPSNNNKIKNKSLSSSSNRIESKLSSKNTKIILKVISWKNNAIQFIKIIINNQKMNKNIINNKLHINSNKNSLN